MRWRQQVEIPILSSFSPLGQEKYSPYENETYQKEKMEQVCLRQDMHSNDPKVQRKLGGVIFHG